MVLIYFITVKLDWIIDKYLLMGDQAEEFDEYNP